MPTQKLYCYVDESGQDTKGRLFVVSVVITTAVQRDAMERALERIERASGKGRVKWIEAERTARLAYIEAVLNDPGFQGTLKYANYPNAAEYFGPTVLTVARAVTLSPTPAAKVTVFVDGLPKSLVHRFSLALRHLGIRTEKVRGVRKEEALALMCLADALCGFVRAALEGHQPFADLLAEAQRNGFVEKI